MAKAAPKLPNDGWTRLYNLEWAPLRDAKGNPIGFKPEWLIELGILRRYEDYAKKANHQLLPWKEHFKKLVAHIWGRPDAVRKFIWNPLADRILDKAISEKFLGIAGHASSGKSETGAIWGITNFLIGARGPNGEASDPRFVKVFVTSTTLEESRMRIWGVIEAYWQELEKFLAQWGKLFPMPGKLVSSKGKIVHVDLASGKASDLAGIALIAGGKGQDKEASTKIGFKARKVILIADELPLLTHQLYATAQGNLFSNDQFQMLGIGNPTSALDPFGIFTEPKDGWGSITEDYDGWETKLGYCIRFDGLKSPNVLEGREVYPGLLTLEKVRAYRETLGPTSPEFYRMVRGFLCPSGNADQIFTEQEIMASLAMQPVTTWATVPRKLAFLDPAWTKGGDRAVAAFGRCGESEDPMTRDRKRVMELTESVDLMLKVNAKHPTMDVPEQVADLYVKECEQRGIPMEDTGVDATGGGTPFAAILTMKAGRGCHLINFGGAPSDMRVSPLDKRTGKQKFANKVSELCYVGKELNRNRQIKGLNFDTVVEMTARIFINRADGKVEVESKKDMKKRTNGKSPDYWDALNGLIELARIKCSLSAASKAAERQAASSAPAGRRSVPSPTWGFKKPPSFRDSAPQLVESGAGWGD